MEGSGSRPDTQGLPFRTIVEQRKAKMNILDLAGISKMKTTVMSAVKKSAGGMTMSATPARLDNGPLVSFLIPALPSAAEDDNPQSTQPKTDIGNGDLLAASSVRSKSVRARRRPISSTAESSMADDTGDSLTSNETMLRRIYNDVNSDEQHGEPIDGVATLHALRQLGFKISEKELWDMLREIDVNEAPKPTTSALGFPQMLEFDFDLDLLDVVGVGQLRQAAAATELEEKLRERRVLFEDFKQLVFLWQSSAQFQLFEERDAETAQRVAEATRTRMLATDGPRMWCWQVAMLMTTTYLVMVAVAIFTNRDVEMAQYFALYTPLDALVTGVLLADIVLKFRCCRVSMVERSPVLLDDAWSVARDYMGSWWFVVDMVTLLPWRFVCFAGGSTTYLMRYDNVTGVLVDAGESGCVGCTTVGDYQARVAGATFLLIVRALKFVEHVRYFEETGLSPVTRWYIFRQFVMGHVFVQLARFGVIVHTLSVIYLSLERWSRGAESADGLSGGVTRYAEAMYLTLYCMATVGYGDIVPKSDAQRVYLMFLCATGWLFSAYVIGSLIGFFQASDIETGRQTTLLELSTLLSYFDVPEPLVLEILSFENYILQNSLVKSFDRVVSDLPADMQRNLELWTRIKIVNRLPLFCDYHRSAKLQICRALVEMTFCPEDYVYLIGEVGEEMFFVNHGFIDILDHDSACEATKRAGDYFGELAAFQLTPSVRANDAKCLSYCEVFVLGRDVVSELRKQYPRVQRGVEAYVAAWGPAEKTRLALALKVRGVNVGFSAEGVEPAVGFSAEGCGVNKDDESAAVGVVEKGADDVFRDNAFAVIERKDDDASSGSEDPAEDVCASRMTTMKIGIDGDSELPRGGSPSAIVVSEEHNSTHPFDGAETRDGMVAAPADEKRLRSLVKSKLLRRAIDGSGEQGAVPSTLSTKSPISRSLSPNTSAPSLPLDHGMLQGQGEGNDQSKGWAGLPSMHLFAPEERIGIRSELAALESRDLIELALSLLEDAAVTEKMLS